MFSLVRIFLQFLLIPVLGRAFSLSPKVRGIPIPHSSLVGDEISNPLQVDFLSGPSKASTPATLELIAARRALKNLKTLLGPSALKSLLTKEIDGGTAAWYSILSAAHDNATSADPGTRVLAEIHFTAVPNDCYAAVPVNLTALNFVGWFTTSAFKHVEKLWAGHPEHYYMDISQNKDGTLAAELVEPWGPVLTHSKVPRMAPVTGQPGGGIKKPWMKAREGFPLQTVGEETLMDGSGAVVGDLHYSFRDLPVQGKIKGQTGRTCGIEAALNMWMPSGTPEEVREGISQHIAIEYYNWVGWAYEDIKSGAYVPA